MVGDDEAQQDDCGQADQTLQGQRVHGALGRENKITQTSRPMKVQSKKRVQHETGSHTCSPAVKLLGD